MKNFMKREKFETELGRKMFDELKAINDNEEWMYVIFYHCRGDENKKKFLDWLHIKDRTPREITLHTVFEQSYKCKISDKM